MVSHRKYLPIFKMKTVGGGKGLKTNDRGRGPEERQEEKRSVNVLFTCPAKPEVVERGTENGPWEKK